MAENSYVCAVDLGAESGRVSIGRFDGTRLAIEVIHRFPNRSVRLHDTLHWDTPAIYAEILLGLRKAAESTGGQVASVGVDTWGVDFGILDDYGALIGIPVHYRDRRTEGLIEAVAAAIPREEIYRQSGIAFWPFNTLYQLRAMALQHSPALALGRTLLFTPDLLHYWLSGVRVSERSIASTSQCLAANDDRWLDLLLASLDIPSSLMPDVVPSGTILGPVRPDVASETNCPGLQVITPASHDTASAVVATPLTLENSAYLSCGTWSLLGIESRTPLTTAEAMEAGFTNEKGVGSSFRFLKNIMGLWLVQQSRASWAREGRSYSYGELADAAEQGKSFHSWIDPNDLSFYAPEDMVSAVQHACAATGQPVPEDVPAIMRCILESLAFTYRSAIDGLESLKGIQIPCLHIIGGGSQNTVLCQWTANALGRPVVAGPVEGTTMGNLLVQMQALQQVADLDQIRQVVRNSCDLVTYEPGDSRQWESAYRDYRHRTAWIKM